MVQIAWMETLTTIVNVSLILAALFQGEIRWKRFLALFVTIYIPAAFAINAGQASRFEFFFALLCIFAGFLVPFISVRKVSRAMKIYVFLFYFGFSSALISSVLWIAKVLQLSDIVMVFLDILVNLLLFLLCLLMNRKTISPKLFSWFVWMPKHIKIFLIAIVWFGETLVSFVSSTFLRYPRSPERITAEMLVALAVIIISVLCPAVVAAGAATTYFKSASENMEKQVRAQVEHYQLLTAANQDMRRFQHDFVNLKIGLKKFLSDENSKGALKYLEECEEDFSARYALFKTGNHVLDALLAEKSAVAESIGATIAFDGFVPDYPEMYAELCVIFGNALDNALEACEELPPFADTVITVKAIFENRFLCIVIQNFTAHESIITDNTIQTTKPDKLRHGIGLSSISRAAARYDGTLTVDNTNKVFTLQIELDLNALGEDREEAVTSTVH